MLLNISYVKQLIYQLFVCKSSPLVLEKTLNFWKQSSQKILGPKKDEVNTA